MNHTRFRSLVLPLICKELLYLFTVSTGSPLDMNVERQRRLAPLLETLEVERAGYDAFHHFNVSMMDALRVPHPGCRKRPPPEKIAQKLSDIPSDRVSLPCTAYMGTSSGSRGAA